MTETCRQIAYAQGQQDMRERAAKICDERGSKEQKANGLGRAAQNYYRARNAIRLLPILSVASDHGSKTPLSKVLDALIPVLTDLGAPGSDGWTNGYVHGVDLDRLLAAVGQIKA